MSSQGDGDGDGAGAVLLTATGQELRTVAEFLAYARLDTTKVQEDYVTLLGAVGLDDVEGIVEPNVATHETLKRYGMTKEMHRMRFIKYAGKCRSRDDRGFDVTVTGDVSDLREQLVALQKHNESLREELAALRAQVPEHPPSTPARQEPDTSVELPHVFVSHSRRDPGALNAARLFAFAMKHAVDRVFKKPFCEACYTGPREGPSKTPHVTLWFDKEAMSKMGGAFWPEVLAAAQHNALATISFLSNAYLGSDECIKELQFADGDGKPLIPFFLESFVNSRQDFLDRHAKWHCDPNLLDYTQWANKKHYVRKTANRLQGVPAFFEDLSVFTCDECRGKRDAVCPVCTSWDTVTSGKYKIKAEQAAAMLGTYIDHLHFRGVLPEQYVGPTMKDGSPDLRMKSARKFDARQKLHSRSVSVEEPGFASLPADVLDDISLFEQTVSSPQPRGGVDRGGGAASILSTLDLHLDAHKFPMHPSLTYFLQDMIDEKGKFRDPSGQEFETVNQCVPLKMVPIALWNEGSQKTKETLDGSEELLVLRRRGYGPSTGYGGGRRTGRTAVVMDVELDDLLKRRPSGRGRATVVLGPAASGKTMMMHRLFVEQATKAMKCTNSTEIVAPYLLRVAELAKWLNGLPPDETSGDLDESTLRRFIQHQHGGRGGAGTPLATELTKLLQRNQLTLLFDGLDEAGAQQKYISRFIGNTLRSHFNGAIVVTSRESLFVGTDFKSNFDLVQIQPLTKQLQQQIVERRFSDDELESKTKFLEESASLPEEMRENPLLLTMLIGVFKKEGSLPRTRSELYEQGIRQLILGRHAEDQVAEIVDFLQSLGHLVHVELKTRDFTESEVVKHLGERSKLLTLYSRAKKAGVDSMKLERALQSDEPEDNMIDLLVQSAESVTRDRLRHELETLNTVFDQAYDTGLIMCVDMNNSENRTFRFTHLTFQEALAAAHCLAKLRTHQESVTDMFKDMFGAAPDPWLREVLLMTAEQMDEKLFEQMAVFFLDADKDDGTGANAVHISSMLTARGENLENPSELGKKILGMLSKLRSTEFMASTLQLPSEQLRRLALKEIEEYTMPKPEISECLLKTLQETGRDAPWYVQTAIVRSLGSLRVSSHNVGSFLVDMCFDRQWHTGVVLEAVRALGNLELENQDCVVLKVLAALDTEELRATAVKTVIAPLRISEKRVSAKLKELLDQRKLSTDVVAAVQALARPVMIDTKNDQVNFFPSTNRIKIRSSGAEPQPQPQPQPQPEPELEPEPQEQPPTQDDIMDAYDPLSGVRKAIDKHLQDRSVLGGTDSINGGMDILKCLTPTLCCMGVAQNLAKVGIVRDQFEQFMDGGTGWWVGSLSVPRADQSTDSDRHAAAKVVWFFHELCLRLLTSNTDGWLDEATTTKTIHVRDGLRYEVGKLATFRGGGGDFKGQVLSVMPDPTTTLPSRCRVTATVVPHGSADAKPTVSENVELLAHQFLETLEMDFKDNTMQTVKLLFGDCDTAGVEMGLLDDFVRPQFDKLVGSSSTRALSVCPVLHYLRYHSARLLRCDPNGDANKAFRLGLEGVLKQMPPELAIFLRKELRVGSAELDRPYWIPVTQIEIVARNQSRNTVDSGDATQPAAGIELSDELKQEATLRFIDTLVEVEVAEAQGFLEHRGWNVEQAIEDYLALKDSEALVSEGVPHDSATSWAAEPTAAETIMNVTACSADQARQALERTGGDIERAVDSILGGGFNRNRPNMSTFSLSYKYPFGRGSAEVSSNARTLEEFNSPGNINDLKTQFSRDLGCRPDEVELEVESCDINPEARGLFPNTRSGLVDYEIEHRERRHGVWGPWGRAGVQSNAQSLREFSSPRNVRQLTRQFAHETGNEVDDVEVRVVGCLHGTGSVSGRTDSTIVAGQPGQRAFEEERHSGETADERARRLGLIDYAIEHRERHNGEWGPWRLSEVASNAASVHEFQGPVHMRQLTHQTAETLGVDPSDCEVRCIGFADPAQAKARGLLNTPAARAESGRSEYGTSESSFLPSDSAAPIPINPNVVPPGGSSSPPTAKAGVAKVMQETDCCRQEAEAALAAANGDVARAIERVKRVQLYD